jgi:transposase-like protein
MQNRKKCHYEESFKLEVLTDYYASGSSVRSITLKYGLSCTRVLLSWLQRYPIDGKELSLSEEVISKHMAKIEDRSNPRSEKALNQRIAELEKALWYANLRARGLELLIDVAEKNEGISIRKKPGAKQ